MERLDDQYRHHGALDKGEGLRRSEPCSLSISDVLASPATSIAASQRFQTTTGVWNLPPNASRSRQHTSDLREVSPGKDLQLLTSATWPSFSFWLSGAFLSPVARFSKLHRWLADPLHVKPSAQVVLAQLCQEDSQADVAPVSTASRSPQGLFHV